MKHFFLLSGLFFWVQMLTSQQEWEGRTAELAFYADVMVNAMDPFHRERAAKTFDNLMENYLKSSSGIKDQLSKIEWISTITPQDSAFRLVTWSWQQDHAEFVYCGFIQLKNGTALRLNSVSTEPTDPDYTEFRPENWYGQIYYNLHEYKTGTDPAYLLFGYRFTKEGRIIKTAEPLILHEGEVIFGKEIFFDEKRHGKSRLTIRYSDNTTASLEYDEALQKIIFDNIVSIINPYEAGKVMMVPEGTYKAYTFKNDKWIYEDSILDTKYKEPPKENKEKNEPQKDLFGR